MTGSGDNNEKTELWPKPDSQCALPDFPLDISEAVGFWTAQGPTVCGRLILTSTGLEESGKERA